LAATVPSVTGESGRKRVLSTHLVFPEDTAGLWLLPLHRLKKPSRQLRESSRNPPPGIQHSENRADGSFFQRTGFQEDERIKESFRGLQSFVEREKNSRGGTYKTKEKAEKRLRQVEDCNTKINFAYRRNQEKRQFLSVLVRKPRTTKLQTKKRVAF